MKNYLFTFLFIISISACAQENKEVRAILDQIIAHAETASMYRNNVDWNTLKPAIHKLAKDANSIDELKPACNYMLAALGDEHGRVFHNNKILAYYQSGDQKPHQATVESEIYNNIQMGQVYHLHGELLNGKIGYLRIVGIAMGNNEKDATEIQTKVCQLMEAGAENWIIDLRYNGGGNMHPMAEGITAIIGEGNAGGSKGLTEDESSTWKVENQHFYYDDQSIELEESCTTKTMGKVAVLTSVYTVSSGEAVAVIFKGREKTKFFGQKTYGMVTVTDWTVISDSTAMTISVSYYKDRNGVVYDEYVGVDMELPFVEEPLSDNDSCSVAAIKWLQEK